MIKIADPNAPFKGASMARGTALGNLVKDVYSALLVERGVLKHLPGTKVLFDPPLTDEEVDFLIYSWRIFRKPG